MKYILIGNNTELNEEDINKLNINSEDIIILFNSCYPIKFDKIKNHKNKILFVRGLFRHNKLCSFHGIDSIIKYHEDFIKIIPVSCEYPLKKIINKSLQLSILTSILNKKISNHEVYNKILNKLSFNESDIIYLSILNISPKYTINKSPSTGLIGYLYVKSIMNQSIDKIILVGFTMSYDGKITTSFHDGYYELLYYDMELSKYNFVHKV